MILQISRILKHQTSHVLEDMIGIAAIFVVLFVGLSLPGII
ncbi:MAG: hypothetical protein ACI861_002331 [Paracoccaceae bacterium]|jgi:hypothetical protein